MAGDTIFNVLKIGSLEVDEDERPLYPPKITGCTIVVNPFDDIVPRISRREHEAARLKEVEAQKKPTEKPKKLKKYGVILNTRKPTVEQQVFVMAKTHLTFTIPCAIVIRLGMWHCFHLRMMPRI